MSKKLVQQQFGDKAAAYATSSVHAKGASLARLVELLNPQPNWRALDVATAAGHTAHIIAPHVAEVVATDITPQMLPKAAELAAEKGLTNVITKVADAEDLPFEDETFDLVTCRIAPHHFPNVAQFVCESVRVLKPEGILAVVDNIVPHKRTRKKKEQQAYEAAAQFINAFEKLRDPSHGRCLSLYEWQQTYKAAGLTVTHTETTRKKMEFASWAARMNVSPEDTTRLRAMLLQPPEIVAEFLTPQFSGDTIEFYLHEAIIIGKKI